MSKAKRAITNACRCTLPRAIVGLVDYRIKLRIYRLDLADRFGKLVADETEKWAKVIKFANLKPE